MCDSWIWGREPDPGEKWVENLESTQVREVIAAFAVNACVCVCVRPAKLSLSWSVNHWFSHKDLREPRSLKWLTGWCRVWGRINGAQKRWVKKPFRARQNQSITLREAGPLQPSPDDDLSPQWKPIHSVAPHSGWRGVGWSFAHKRKHRRFVVLTVYMLCWCRLDYRIFLL